MTKIVDIRSKSEDELGGMLIDEPGDELGDRLQHRLVVGVAAQAPRRVGHVLLVLRAAERLAERLRKGEEQ